MRKSKIIALILALAMVITVAVGCSDDAKPVVTFKNTVIDENEFCYMLSNYKATYLYGYFGMSQDNPALWTQEMAEGITVGDYLSALSISSIMSNAVYIELFSEYGLTLTTEDINAVDAKITELIEKSGGKSNLNKSLAKYGADIDVLKNVYTDTVKISKLQNYLFGENGVQAATDEEIEEYYKENYMRCKFILIHAKEDFVYDANGEPVFDEDTQKYVTREMSEDEVAAKKALASDVNTQLLAGADFEELLDTYTMDSGMRHFEDGYYITSASTFVEDAVKETVADMDIGQTEFLETDSGWYIIKRYELRDGVWADEKYASAMFGNLFDTVNSIKMNELVTPFADQIVVDTAAIKNYPMAAITPNFEY